MDINSQEYAQKLSEKYQLQCLQFFQEILNLQVQIEIKDKQIKELELQLRENEAELIEPEQKIVNVNTTSDT